MIIIIGSCFHKEPREMIIVQALDIFVRRLFNPYPIIAHMQLLIWCKGEKRQTGKVTEDVLR